MAAPVLAGGQPRARCPLTPCTYPHRAQPFQEEAENTSLFLEVTSPSSLTFLPPLPTLCAIQVGGATFPDANPPPWPFHCFSRLPPTSVKSPQLSLLSFPFHPLTAIYCPAVFRRGMQPVPGKELMPLGLSRLSLVPGSVRDRLCDTNQRLNFSLPQFPSVDSKVSPHNLSGARAGLYCLFTLCLSLELLPWPRSLSASIINIFMLGFH